jgi:hypothetical protein
MQKWILCIDRRWILKKPNCPTFDLAFVLQSKWNVCCAIAYDQSVLHSDDVSQVYVCTRMVVGTTSRRDTDTLQQFEHLKTRINIKTVLLLYKKHKDTMTNWVDGWAMASNRSSSIESSRAIDLLFTACSYALKADSDWTQLQH